MARNDQEVASRLALPGRLWAAGKWNLGTPVTPHHRPAEPADPSEPARPPEPPARQVGPPQVDALWHQVTRGEDWAALVARYNVPDPGALLEANGLQAPRPLVPGEWVRVPCDLVRPVWELDLSDERGETPDGE